MYVTLTPRSTHDTSWRVGTLHVTREEAETRLGPPNRGGSDKTTHEWALTAPDGTPIYIYDYWWNPEGIYSIGSTTTRAAAWLRLVFGPAARLRLY